MFNKDVTGSQNLLLQSKLISAQLSGNGVNCCVQQPVCSLLLIDLVSN